MTMQFSRESQESYLGDAIAVQRPISPGNSLYRDGFKRLLDILFVILLGAAALPLVALCALAIAMDGRSPFYAQKRIGRNGRIFKMWKLRSMVPDAELMLEEHLAERPDLRAEWDAHQKLRDDPRITWVGRIIRKTSFDELPQLWNVLKGDMSVVGPRPMMVEQKPIYPGTSYFLMRPGITGLWQISDRNLCTFRQRVHFDEDYYGRLSFWLDITVMFRTLGAVYRCSGC